MALSRCAVKVNIYTVHMTFLIWWIETQSVAATQNELNIRRFKDIQTFTFLL